MKYKKKPVAIEAFQFDGDLKGSDGKYYVPEWAVKAFEEGILYFDALTPDTPPIELFIKTLEGTMHAPVGSYVIQGVRGEIYCCKEDIFLETYEPVLERELKNVYVTDTKLGTIVSNMKEDLDAGSAMFINVETTRGLLQFAAYNEHNGYYGHDVLLVSKYDDKTVIEADDVL